MNFIQLGDQNPLKNSDGQARVANVLLEQVCLLRAEVGAIQATLINVGVTLGVEARELVQSRIEMRDDLYQRIQADVRAKLTGSPPSKAE